MHRRCLWFKGPLVDGEGQERITELVEAGCGLGLGNERQRELDVITPSLKAEP